MNETRELSQTIKMFHVEQYDGASKKCSTWNRERSCREGYVRQTEQKKKKTFHVEQIQKLNDLKKNIGNNIQLRKRKSRNQRNTKKKNNVPRGTKRWTTKMKLNSTRKRSSPIVPRRTMQEFNAKVIIHNKANMFHVEHIKTHNSTNVKYRSCR